MNYTVAHTTRYDYDSPVTVSHAEVHQLPGDMDGQICRERSVVTDPAPAQYRERRDYFGNLVAQLTIRQPHTTLLVTSTSVVDTAGRSGEYPDEAARAWEQHRADQRPAADLRAVEFSLDSPSVVRSTALANYARPSFGAGVSLADALTDLTARVNGDFTFDVEATEVDTPLEVVLRQRRGVCQDFAHVVIGCLRSIGLAACYVSGYLETDPPPGERRLTGVDRTHAWVGVHLGGEKFLGVDPTNNQLAGSRYVTAAHGRDYGDVPPLKGVIFTDSEDSTLTVSVDVSPV